MTTYAGTQNSVSDPYVGLPGDQWGLPETWTQGQGLNPTVAVTVGNFVWAINNTKNCTNVKGSNTQLAGLVLRNQANVFAAADINLGYSNTIDAGYTAPVARNGNFLVEVVSLNGGGAINVGEAVFVRNADGVPVVGATDEVAYTQTDFVVIFTSTSANSAQLGTDVVGISNINQTLGN